MLLSNRIRVLGLTLLGGLRLSRLLSRIEMSIFRQMIGAPPNARIELGWLWFLVYRFYNVFYGK